MENSKIVEILTPYFEDKKVDSLILCDDSNVFYKEGKHYAEFHCNNAKVKSGVVTRDMFNEMKKEVDKAEKEAKAKEEAKIKAQEEAKKKAEKAAKEKAEKEAKSKEEAEKKVNEQVQNQNK